VLDRIAVRAVDPYTAVEELFRRAVKEGQP
jgi:hypothetical protein